MSNYSRVAAVTGANKGIGLAIARQLALQYPSSAFNNGPLLVYVTARDKERGEAAIKDLQTDRALKKARALSQDGGLSEIRFHELDISQTDSIRKFADFLRKEHPDGIDFFINNAAIAMNGFDNNVVKKTLETNYYGTLESTQIFLPLIRPGGRLVNVSSAGGRIGKYSSEVQQKFKSATSVPEITALMEDFKQSAADGTLSEHGWTAAAYAASKAGVTFMTKVVAEEEAKRGRGVLVNACCPGYVATDMTRGGGIKTPDQGAQTPVMLALADIGGKYGLFWESEKPASWT